MTDHRHTPERTCIAKRHKLAANRLLRCVVDPGAAAGDGTALVVVPDPERVLPGRGAWLTPTVGALELALKKRAFNRAFRVSTPVDASAVLAYLLKVGGQPDTDVTTNEKDDRQLMSTR